MKMKLWKFSINCPLVTFSLNTPPPLSNTPSPPHPISGSVSLAYFSANLA